MNAEPPHTPDGCYFVVRGRLWRATRPDLPETLGRQLVADLMKARRDVGDAIKRRDPFALKHARARVNEAKTKLGERGPLWWDAAEGDFNRHMAVNSPYADWFKELKEI